MTTKIKPAKECTIAELEAYSTPLEFERYYYFKYGNHPTIEAVWEAATKVAIEKK